MITFIRSISISINVVLKPLLIASVIPHWGIYTKRRHPDTLSRELCWQVLQALPQYRRLFHSRACPSWISPHLAPIDAWRKGQATLAQWRDVCDPELHTGLSMASVLTVCLSTNSSFSCHFHKYWSLFCTPTQLQSGLPENPVCEMFIQIDLISFLRYVM